LEQLWRHVLLLLVNGCDQEKEEEVQLHWLTLSVFCDIFAHHLIGVSDAEFLEQYTFSSGSTVVVSAEHVIARLRDVLYDLYWTQPVLSSHFRVVLLCTNVPALKARLLLSGTKVWNSLYERWCRLVRQSPFCDESTWWFPRLAARDDDGAVISSREASDPMDEDDDDDSVESMEVDEPTTAEQESDALAGAFRDPKMARVLTCIPQALPFDRRVKLFDALLNADKEKTQDETADFRRAVFRMMQRGEEDTSMNLSSREAVEIRRDSLYPDSMRQLNTLGRRLKHKVQVTFINQHGTKEAGIDGGGVFKEFLDDLIKKAFDPTVQESDGIPKLFSVTPLQTLAVNLDLRTTKETLQHYEFLGRVLGKAVYESILVEPQFCLPFLNQLLGKQNALEDLKNFDGEYYSNLIKLKTLSAREIDELGLTFELTLGPHCTVPLLPGGSMMAVTKQNVVHYIHLVAHRRLNVEGAAQTRAFLKGFRDLVPASWVRLFSAYELQKLVSGDDTQMDVAGLQKCMQYAAGYHPSQPIIVWFWEVIHEMTPAQQKQFLRFMTSCSRQPLLGFSALEPAPCVQQIRLPDEVFATGETEKNVPLPSSSTCMNLLKLPNYRSKELLRKKLLVAVESGAGFELS